MPTATRRPQGKPLFTIPNCAGGYIFAMNCLGLVRYGISLVALAASVTIYAAQTITLPNWVCAFPDAIFVSEFDADQIVIPSNSSGGSGGANGSVSRIVGVSSFGNHKYYLYVPTTYDGSRAYPFILVLHGTAPYGSQTSYAMAIRDSWSTVAESGQFIVAAPVADEIYDDQNGQPYAVSWLVPPYSPSDYDVFAAVLSDVESAYNIERTRVYGWGFSAGGSVMYDLALNDYSAAFNATTMAAYSVSAGAMGGLACSYSPNTCPALLQSQARNVPVDIHVGTADSPGYSYAEADDADFVSHGWTDGSTVFFNTFTGGHVYSTSDLQIAWGHLCPNAVTP